MDGGVPPVRQLTLDDGPGLIPALEELASQSPSLKVQAGLALAYLSSGRMVEGWKQYDHQLRDEARSNYEDFPVPRWDGEDLKGKHVLAWLDRGIGDQVFAAGILPDLIETVGPEGSVTLLTLRRLSPLLRRSFPTVEVYRVGETPSARLKAMRFDYQLALPDLGLAFRRSLDFAQKPYLVPDHSRVAEFRRKYETPGHRLIGLSWWSRNAITGAGKSAFLESLEPILRWPNVTFVNLQYGYIEDEVKAAGEKFGARIIVDQSFNQLTNVDAFAAQVASLDGVVTTSNSTAHIAGGLGVPGIVLLPRGLGRFWYWHDELETSPWYPSLRLARQDVPGDWRGLANKVDRDLKDFIQPRAVSTDTPAPGSADWKDTRIAELEDALQEFAIFASAASVPMEAKFAREDEVNYANFLRDTRTFDQSAFWRAAELTRGFR